MEIREQHLFANGQFKQAIVLIPDRLPLHYRVLAAIAGIGLLTLFGFLFHSEGDSLKPLVFCGSFGLIALAFAFGKASYEVIQEYEIRMRISLGPASFILKKCTLSSDIPFIIEQNDSDEIMLVANKDLSEQLSIGPFHTKEQAEQTFQKIQFIDLDAAGREENRVTRAKEKIRALTADVRPSIPRAYQFTLVAVFTFIGFTGDSVNNTLIAILFVATAIFISEGLVISTTVVEKVAPDYSEVVFSVRTRFFWKNIWSIDPNHPTSLSFLKRTFNPSSITPFILAFLSIALLYGKKEPPAEERQRAEPPVISPEDEEAARRGLELLNQAKEARDRQRKESSGEE